MDFREYVSEMKNLLTDTSSYVHAISRRSPSGGNKVIAPFIPSSFIYMWTFFNSLYNVDWEAGITRPDEAQGRNCSWLLHYDSLPELTRVKKVVAFLFAHHVDTSGLTQAFFPNTLTAATEEEEEEEDKVEEAIQHILPDDVPQGAFYMRSDAPFHPIKAILLKAYHSHDITEDELYRLLEFIYKVRCNIFHGVKTVEMMSEEPQSTRLAIYTYIVQSVCTQVLKHALFDIHNHRYQQQNTSRRR